MRKQVEIWKVLVIGGLMLAAYVAGIGAGSGGRNEAYASPTLGFPDSGAQFNQMIRSLDALETSVKASNGQLQEINELLKSGNLQVVVKDGRPGAGSNGSGSGGEIELRRQSPSTGQSAPLSRLVE